MRWSRNRAFASAPPIALWPSISTHGLSAKELDRFDKAVTAVTLYSEGETGKNICARTGINATDLPRLSKRCLQLAPDGQIVGFRALMGFVRLNPYERNELAGPKRQEQQGGQSGSLGYLIKLFPEIEKELVAHIRQDAKALKVSEKKITGAKLHNVFIMLLKEKVRRGQYPALGWPFNTKHRGRRTIQSFMRDVVYRNFSRSVAKRSERPAKAHLYVGTGEESLLLVEEPFDAVEIDSHEIHLQVGVLFNTPEGVPQIVRIERLWLLAIVDRRTGPVLGWLIVYRSEVSANDVVRLIHRTVTKKWEPKEFSIPGLKYLPGAGLPSGTIKEAEGAVWNLTLFDNALAHLAKKVSEDARKRFGFVINLGPPGHFERRPNIERTFRMVEEELQRLPSTTGSNPFNGRADDAEGAVLRHQIEATHIEELIEVILANSNVIPGGIAYHSPLQEMSYYLSGVPALTEVRRLPLADHVRSEMAVTIERRRISGGLKNGRRPYVQVDEAHYTNQVLRDAGELIGKYLLLHIDEDDMRNVHAYLENGTDLGILSAERKWSLSCHSRQTRRIINSLISKKILVVSEMEDPVQVYLKFLGTRRPSSKQNNKPPLSAKNATKAARVSQEAGIEPTIHAEPSSDQRPTSPTLHEAAAKPTLLKGRRNPPPRFAKNRR